MLNRVVYYSALSTLCLWLPHLDARNPKKPHPVPQPTSTQKRGVITNSASAPAHPVPPSASQHELFEWFGTFSEVISLVERKAFRTVDFAKFIQESLKGAVAQVDAHSSFFSHDHYKSAMESTTGQFSGIGISIVGKMPDDEALGIVDIVTGSPAAKAGIIRGDKIIQIDDQVLRGLTTDEVVAKLKGPVGSTVQIKLLRNNKKTVDVAVVRELIKDQVAAVYHFTGPNVLYCSLKMFSEQATQQIEKFLARAEKEACRGIIIDLRRNPGGVLDIAVSMAGLFVPKGSLVAITKDNGGKVIGQYHTSNEPVFKHNRPVFVLVDSFTASAAEILAGTLRHYSAQKGEELMVFVVGTPTFGKGSVQEVIPLSNGCALKLTTMLYYLADDTLIQAVGIVPDFVVFPKLVPTEQMRTLHDLYGSESALRSHISLREVQAPHGVCKLTDKETAKRQADLQKEAQTIKQRMLRTERNEKEQADPAQIEKDQHESLVLDNQLQACVNMIMLFDCTKNNSPSLVNTREKALSFLKSHYLTDAYEGVKQITE